MQARSSSRVAAPLLLGRASQPAKKGMAAAVNLARPVPEGLVPIDSFTVQSLPVPELGDGLLVELLCLSADPYMRGGLKLGRTPRTMAGYVSGRVLASAVDGWSAGDLFGASLPFVDIQAISAKQLESLQIWKLSDHLSEADIGQGIGALGMPGSTAYGGLIDILQPRAGETIWVSGAAGAVGSMVGQIAKSVFGCRVIGSAGGPTKCELVTSKFGFDGCVDYKTCSTKKELIIALSELAPEGIDMYFENVGGIHFEAAMSCLRPQGRVAVCGTISNYNDGQPEPNQIHVSNMIYNNHRIEGFVCTPWLSGERGNFLADMSGWIKAGQVRSSHSAQPPTPWPNFLAASKAVNRPSQRRRS